MTTPPVTLDPISFAQISGWHDDDHLSAFQAFLASSHRLCALAECADGYLGKPTSQNLLATAHAARQHAAAVISKSDACDFFESHFQPVRVRAGDMQSLLTGYYEPVLKASRTPNAQFHVPLMRRPERLVNLVSDADRGQFGDQLTHAFLTDDGAVACPTRKEIDSGALADGNLIFAWLDCLVDAYFLHVEGSGQLEFDDGSTQRVTYDGKNGHPYTSIGQYLIEHGVFAADQMSFQALKAWLKEDIERAQRIFHQNRSYIFFRPVGDNEPNSALGVMQIPLQPLRSLAVDTTYHEIGTPIFVSAPDLTHAGPGKSGFARLMIAHDVGSAIRGPERGDIYFGTGEIAGDQAGQTVHAGSFVVLKPKGVAA